MAIAVGKATGGDVLVRMPATLFRAMLVAADEAFRIAFLQTFGVGDDLLTQDVIQRARRQVVDLTFALDQLPE